ncbi:MAG: DedA family protein [Acidobacteriota bacterium]
MLWASITNLVSTHGYWVVAVVVAVESMGIPLPGETILVTAGIYAGTTHRLNIWIIIAAAALGAIAGDSAGFLIGRRFGYRLLLRYGRYVRMNEARIKLGQFLFDRHGGKVVFFGRFVAVLRTLAALLAGMNGMDWRRFLVFNASGGIAWAVAFGAGAYAFGEQIERVRGPIAVVTLVAAAFAGVILMWFVGRHEAELEAQAERALPGPLRSRL